ncbi:MAG TPA: GlsB/YeaQ/YmgE family stress response membrane protein [Mycobacteriales bacterium]|jgi:uncharacterized membrane protein YeaQ/YmgE (transglycosylase-associated protein family)|nr:GlsB/YeaQ/YmgE family stress response membrane protein [Mycobacteriales bacterium]
MSDICTLLIVGVAIGALARIVVPGYQPIGFLFTVLIGVLGSVGGGYVAKAADLNGLFRWAIAVGISAVLVAIVAGFMRRSSRHNQGQYPPSQHRDSQ